MQNVPLLRPKHRAKKLRGGTLAACFLVLALLLGSSPAASQEESWKDRFDRICGQTETAADLSPEQLQILIDESNALLDVIAGVEDQRKKLYLFRLQKCRDMFRYLLDLKTKDGTPAGPS